MHPTRRFSNRAEYYRRYRPGYPKAIVSYLENVIGLKPSQVIADVGSGTGILSELFLKYGNTVYGVEPNPEMRLAAERQLRGCPNFISVDGTAESTTLPAKCVDLITAGQAFHWFEREQAKYEFGRILKRGGAVVLVWNLWDEDKTAFMRSYEDCLEKYQIDHPQIYREEGFNTGLKQFFSPPGYQLMVFENHQAFNYEGLKGRFLSASYAPLKGHPNHRPMLNALQVIFDQHQVNGEVKFEYETKLYWGRLD